MGKPTGRRAAWVSSAVLVVALLCAGAAFRNDLAVEYYSYRLKRSPGAILAALESKEKHPSRVALERLAAVPKGRRMLLDLYLSDVMNYEEILDHVLGGTHAVITVEGDSMWYALNQDQARTRLPGGQFVRKSPRFRMEISNIETLQRLLASSGDETYESPSCPGMRFRFFPATSRILRAFPGVPTTKAQGPVCLVTRKPSNVGEILAELLYDEPRLRREAALDLERILAHSAQAIPQLVQALDREHDVAELLASLGPRAVPALVAQLTGPEEKGRYPAATVLGRMAPRAAQVVPALLPALSHENPRVRALAARALGELGPAAHEAQPRLREALQDPDQFARECAAGALRKIEAE